MRLQDILGRLDGSGSTLTFLSDSGAETLRTFAELHVDTQSLVAWLRSRRIGAGERVGILAPNSYRWMVWDLAIMTVGAVSVALPQERPAASVDEIADRRGLRLLAAASSLVGDEALQRSFVVDIDADFPPDDKSPLLQPAFPCAPGTHSLAFSSGTTGKTKGLVISAPGTENLLNLYADAFGVVPDDRLLTFLPFANYQQRMAYYFCLYHGIDFVYVPFTRMFAGIKKYQPSYVIAPPVFYESLQNLAQAHAGPPQADPAVAERLKALLGGRIRYLITGMAPIKQQTLEFFWVHGISLFEAFGITEAGMVTWNKPGQVKIGTVGKPAEPGSVSLSEEGEVIVTRPALLSLGYFESSEEDAQSTFISANAVATGDIARFDAEGYLTIIGRKKDAILTKAGEKFHPESIEVLIQDAPGIGVVVVLGGEGLPGVTALLSTPLAGNVDAETEIRSHIARVNSGLPTGQQIKRIEFTSVEFKIENGFRTKNLKLNRKAILSAFVEHGISLGLTSGVL